MFGKKKEAGRSTLNNEIPARLIKKGQDTSSLPPSGYGGYPHHQPFPNVYKPGGSYASKQYNIRGIPEFDVSESYLSNHKQWQQTPSTPSSTKSNRRKFAPSFPFRKKKTHDTSRHNYVNVDIKEEDETDIARFEDFDQQSMNSVMIGHLDDNQLNTASDENFENVYQRRIEFIRSHYQKPPPYRGKNNMDGFQGSIVRASSTPHLESDVDAPLLRQLLKDKQLTDNASMNNFWQAGPSAQNDRNSQSNDRLVSRTQNVPNSMKNVGNNSKELFEKRKQHYNLLTINENTQQQPANLATKNQNNRDAISEIIYPAGDYEGNNLRGQAMNLSASVPNLSMQYTDNMVNPGTFTVPRKPRDRIEPGEMEALIAHYRKTSLDTFEPYGMSGESSSLYSEGSSSYVPPSPYMSAEIPDWLQVYAKASADLDHYLKWEMFRYPELDCWQTMLKRLYKKELEQVVLWFEEYRIALYEEINRQESILLQQHQQQQQHQQHQHYLRQQQQQQQNQLQIQSQMLSTYSMDDLRKTDV